MRCKHCNTKTWRADEICCPTVVVKRMLANANKGKDTEYDKACVRTITNQGQPS